MLVLNSIPEAMLKSKFFVSVDNSELADAVFRSFLEKDVELLEDVEVKVLPPFFF